MDPIRRKRCNKPCIVKVKSEEQNFSYNISLATCPQKKRTKINKKDMFNFPVKLNGQIRKDVTPAELLRGLSKREVDVFLAERKIAVTKIIPEDIQKVLEEINETVANISIALQSCRTTEEERTDLTETSMRLLKYAETFKSGM